MMVKKRDDCGVEGPYQQQQAETQGGRLRTSSRKTGGGEIPHAPAEMSEADLLTTTSSRCAETSGAPNSPSDGESSLVRRHLRCDPPGILRGLPEV